ncbi:MAG: M16 family metallopeptidase [Vulcanimicrobiaceae bacterium]
MNDRLFARAGAALGLALALVVPTMVPAADSNASDVTRATLANGLQVVIVRDPLAPVATVYDNILAGADETPPGFPGMAHAQEHMAFRGCSGDLSGDQTSAIFAQLGGDGDADTQQNITQFFSTVPAVDLDVALHVDSDCLRNITDAQSQWSQERNAIEQEVAQDLSNPVYKAFSQLSAILFAGTPYAHDPLGTRPSFDATTGALLKKFDDTWYAPNNAILVIVGDVDPQATLAQVQKLYGSIPSHLVPARPDVDLLPVKAQTISTTSDLPVAVDAIGYRLPGSDEVAQFAAMQVLFDVLASQRGDLYALVPAGKALQAGALLYATYPKASIGLIYGALPFGTTDTSAFDGQLLAVIANYAKNGVPDDLVQAAVRQELAQLEFERNSIPDLASSWSQALAAEGRQSPDEDIAAIGAVTTAEVNSILRTYLQPQLGVRVSLLPQPSGGPIASKGFGGAETATTAPTKPVILPSWAQARLATIEVPPNALAPADMRLPNGIRLIVQPETISPTVSVVGEVENQPGLQVPHGQEGVGDVLDGLFSYGTTTLDRLAFQKALDDIAAQESAGTSFSLSVLADKFDRGVQLLADNELHPALPADAFTVVRAQTAAEIAGNQKTPSYLASRALATALYPSGDPALREPTPTSAAAVSLDDVKAYYAKAFRPDLATIVVIGDVTPDAARATIEKYFGGWTASGPKPQLALPPVPANRPATTVVPDKSRVQDTVSLAETTPLLRKAPDYYAFELGEHVLGGGFYATRLYHDLREVSGLVYFVESRLAAGKTRSTYTIEYGCDPPNVAKARALIVRDLRQMQTQDVGQAELEQAKAILLRQLPLVDGSESDLASTLLARARAELPLDEGHRAAEIYAKLTAAQVRAAFAKYVRPSDFVQVVQGPNPS